MRKILLSLLLVPLAYAPSQPAPPEKSPFTEQEVAMVVKHADITFAYMPKDVCMCMRVAREMANVPEINMVCQYLDDNMHVIEEKIIRKAVDCALEHMPATPEMMAMRNTLESYKTDLENGDAKIIIQKRSGRRGKNSCGTFSKLCAKCLTVESLKAGNATICGDLNVFGKIFPPREPCDLIRQSTFRENTVTGATGPSFLLVSDMSLTVNTSGVYLCLWDGPITITSEVKEPFSMAFFINGVQQSPTQTITLDSEDTVVDSMHQIFTLATGDVIEVRVMNTSVVTFNGRFLSIVRLGA